MFKATPYFPFRQYPGTYHVAITRHPGSRTSKRNVWQLVIRSVRDPMKPTAYETYEQTIPIYIRQAAKPQTHLSDRRRELSYTLNSYLQTYVQNEPHE